MTGDRPQSRLRDERGSVLVLVAASLTALIGCGAFVLDLGNQRQTARNEQNAADAGALAGAVGLPLSAAPPGTAFESAARYAFQTMFGRNATGVSCPLSNEPPPGQTKCYEPAGGGQGTIVYVTTPWGPDPVGDGSDPSMAAPADNQIHVKVCSDVETGLAKIFGVGNLRPCRESTAINTLSSALPFAFGAMAPSGSGTFTMSGTGSVTANGNVVVNSNTDNGLCDVALPLSGSGNLSATAIEVRDPAGLPDAWEDCGIGSFFPQPVNGFSNPPLLDPLCPNPNDPSSCLSYPGEPGCPPNPPPAQCNSTTIEAPGDTIGPGVYDEIIVNSGTLTMMPGLYVFRGTGGGSKFEINGGTVVGNGVTLFFACQSYPATCGDSPSYLSIGENPPPCPPPGAPCPPQPAPRATFTAPLPGSYPDERIPGMAIFFDRNAPQSGSAPPGIGIFGDASLNVTGTIYAPSIRFEAASGGASTLNSAVIVNRFEHSGSGSITVTYNEDENVKVTGGIALIS